MNGASLGISKESIETPKTIGTPMDPKEISQEIPNGISIGMLKKNAPRAKINKRETAIPYKDPRTAILTNRPIL